MPLKWLEQSPVLGQDHLSPGGQEFLHVHEFGQSPADHNRICFNEVPLNPKVVPCANLLLISTWNFKCHPYNGSPFRERSKECLLVIMPGSWNRQEIATSQIFKLIILYDIQMA